MLASSGDAFEIVNSTVFSPSQVNFVPDLLDVITTSVFAVSFVADTLFL